MTEGLPGLYPIFGAGKSAPAKRDRVLACDLDGVVFDFNSRAINWMNSRYGVQIPPVSLNYPDTWNYPLDGGYLTDAQFREFFAFVASPGPCYTFWSGIPAYRWSRYFLARAIAEFDSVVFITDRPGDEGKKASEDALSRLGVVDPRVVIASNKAEALADVGATHFIDDRPKNFNECCHLPGIAFYVLDQPWNRTFSNPQVTRIWHPLEMFNKERVTGMNIDQFQATNAERGRRWHHGDLSQWTPLEWTGAMAGEAGEAANVAKKLRRLDLALPNRQAGLTQADADHLREKLADEVADTIIYGLLILSLLGVNASDVIARVFDRKSIEYGFPERARG